MANEHNLIPRTELSKEEARKLQLLSAEKRKKNNKEKLVIKEALEKRLKVKDLNEMLDNLIERAKNDDNSFKTMQEALGQKPKEQSQIDISGGVVVIGGESELE